MGSSMAYGAVDYDKMYREADEKMYEMKRRMKMENTLKMDVVDSRLPQ